jgi:ABC-type antimicrobial peptide transport system permease subunit
LGARPAQVRSLLLRRVLLQLGAGLVLGLPGAVIVRELPWMADGGVLTLASMIGLVVAVAMTASLLSVRRATELDPVAALRLE